MAETIKVVDTKRIKAISFTMPELMSDSAETTIKRYLLTLQEAEQELSELRKEEYRLEDTIKELKSKLRTIQGLFNVEYEYTEKEVIKNEASFGIRGMGNSTLGEKKMV